ncbi:1-acyl-sn-glycerol-3-phosphate acyltransferase [Tersicoccus sp. Bi-70]|uniref:lysophospholipid acyltransferase family protein n=1 Tax=Tersicoccus sp. Bi-70 TaxID=1897634 RepID=UPI0009786204|nr:lysophospholipid acyltransferase family protein [Tersicoccus sp. Bi-70]OMH33076.1 acyl-phosphate glycerol 3-phosphate acyltransferase [Tersicoccus sp. Bi-70]
MSVYESTRAASRAAFRLSCRPRLSGLANFPASGPVIVAPNHLSFLDSIIVSSFMPRRVSFFAKAEYFTSPGFKGAAMRTFFEGIGSIPVERGEQAASVAALQTALEVLDRGDVFGIYPEGTRSRDGKLYRGKTGVGWLALTTGAPVVPVGLIGTEKLQPADSMMVTPRRFTMKVGEPLYFDRVGPGHSLPQRREVTDRIMEAIAGLTGQERVGRYNQRPGAE